MPRTVHAPFGALLFAAAGALSSAGFAQEVSTNQDGSLELAAVVKRYDTERAEMMERMNAAESEAESTRIYEEFDAEPFVKAFFDVGVHNAGSDVAAEAFLWIVRVGKDEFPDDAKEAVTILTSNHLDSEVLTQLVDEIRYWGPDPFADETLATIREGSTVRAVQANAQLCLAQRLMAGRETPEATADCRKRARAMLLALQTDFADVGGYVKTAERNLFELDHLQIGMPAPDFETTDSDGVPFKLSDYRGKVTVVDFWGFW